MNPLAANREGAAVAGGAGGGGREQGGGCGRGDLEQTPRRLSLAALGRSTLLSLRAFI